jgi:ADP-heptose:LPS heptosyltransferase
MSKNRIQPLFITVQCIFLHLYRRLFGRTEAMPHTFIIIQTSQLGDLVCTTPMFRAIKKHDPNNRIIVVGKKVNRLILEHSPDVDVFVDYHDDPRELGKRLRSFGPHVGIVAVPHFQGLASLVYSGASRISAPYVVDGFCPTQTISYRVLRRVVADVTAFHFGRYMPRQYLRLLEVFGIHTDDTSKTLAISPEDRERMDNWLSERGFTSEQLIIGISPSAGNRIKMWPLERFAEVGRYLVERYHARLVVVSGPGETEDRDALLLLLGAFCEPVDASGLDLSELKALIGCLSLFIAVDTGPIYIAEALGIPTVDIVGPMDEREQPPRGDTHAIVIPQVRREPQMHILNARIFDRDEARRQVESITTDMVTGGLSEFYDRVLMMR